MSERENEQDSGADTESQVYKFRSEEAPEDPNLAREGEPQRGEQNDDTESHRTRFHGQEEAPEDPNLAREGEPQKGEQDDDTESHRIRFHKPGE
jgi:hypothetical protein